MFYKIKTHERTYKVYNAKYYRNTEYANHTIAEPWICGTIHLYEKNFIHQKPMFTAQILFRYPTVGRIVMRQPRDEPWADTIILIDYLVHADGSSLNNSAEHRWAIHELPPGKDFYNWTGRCLSSGPVYNPYKVSRSMQITNYPKHSQWLRISVSISIEYSKSYIISTYYTFCFGGIHRNKIYSSSSRKLFFFFSI